MVKLINNLIKLFDSEDNVCYKTLKLLLEDAKDNKNDGLILLSLCGEGTSLNIKKN